MKNTPKENDEKTQPCSKCGGVGAILDSDGELIICPRCNGSCIS